MGIGKIQKRDLPRNAGFSVGERTRHGTIGPYIDAANLSTAATILGQIRDAIGAPELGVFAEIQRKANWVRLWIDRGRSIGGSRAK